MSSYLKNAWYAAAWSDEVGRQLLRRMIMDQDLVFFRKEDGTAVAMSNRCVHRFAPMHRGKIVGDTVECPYHGLRYDGSGQCVFNPDGDQIVPRAARLQTYPLVERYGLLWIWPGTAGEADPDCVPDFSHLTDTEHWASATGLFLDRANYRHIIDNLMDAAHVAILHRDSIASDAVTRGKIKVRDKGDEIWCERWCDAADPGPAYSEFWAAAFGAPLEGQIAAWVDTFWSPGAIVGGNIGFTPAGQSREQGVNTKATHLMTPETERTTHHFWGASRNFLVEDEKYTEAMREQLLHAIEHEDGPMTEAVQEIVGDQDFWELKPLLLPADAAAVRVRRRLDDLVRQENAAVASEPIRQKVMSA